MDDRLETYFGVLDETAPPHISEQKVRRILENRERRRSLVAVSAAALLWMVLAVMVNVWVFREVSAEAAYIAGGLLCVGLMSAAVFSGLVLKYKKVGDVI